MSRAWMGAVLIALGCSEKAIQEVEAGAEVELTLSNCQQSVDDGVPAFFSRYFACSDISMSGDDVTVWTDGLPPTPSAYYPSTDPNYVEFDDRGGSHFQNPNTLDVQNVEITFPSDPTPKGLTIDGSLVDNTMNTSTEEYGGGAQGITLNGVVAFAAMAAPGDDLSAEQYTFDLYEGHPAGSTYHYHFNSPGPLEVLVDRGYSDNAEIGEGTVELYGMMCDGTVVMGCTELDGTAPDDGDFDSQNGHVHDIDDGTDTLLANRYHTHVCASEWTAYPFFPEIAYYDGNSCPRRGP